MQIEMSSHASTHPLVYLEDLSNLRARQTRRGRVKIFGQALVDVVHAAATTTNLARGGDNTQIAPELLTLSAGNAWHPVGGIR